MKIIIKSALELKLLTAKMQIAAKNNKTVAEESIIIDCFENRIQQETKTEQLAEYENVMLNFLDSWGDSGVGLKITELKIQNVQLLSDKILFELNQLFSNPKRQALEDVSMPACLNEKQLGNLFQALSMNITINNISWLQWDERDDLVDDNEYKRIKKLINRNRCFTRIINNISIHTKSVLETLLANHTTMMMPRTKDWLCEKKSFWFYWAEEVLLNPDYEEYLNEKQISRLVLFFLELSESSDSDDLNPNDFIVTPLRISAFKNLCDIEKNDCNGFEEKDFQTLIKADGMVKCLDVENAYYALRMISPDFIKLEVEKFFSTFSNAPMVEYNLMVQAINAIQLAVRKFKIMQGHPYLQLFNLKPDQKLVISTSLWSSPEDLKYVPYYSNEQNTDGRKDDQFTLKALKLIECDLLQLQKAVEGIAEKLKQTATKYSQSELLKQQFFIQNSKVYETTEIVTSNCNSNFKNNL